MSSHKLDQIDRNVLEILQANAKITNAQLSKETRGGIDFNTQNLKTDVQGDAIDMRFDASMVAQFKRGDFTGVRPVILSITPLSSVMSLLGIPSAGL